MCQHSEFTNPVTIITSIVSDEHGLRKLKYSTHEFMLTHFNEHARIFFQDSNKGFEWFIVQDHSGCELYVLCQNAQVTVYRECPKELTLLLLSV